MHMPHLVEIDGVAYRTDPADAIDTSIPLQFAGSQPNAFEVEPASSHACEYGALIGDTRRGGSCNFEQITLIPHCNGTHTECVGHITHERISVRDCLREAFLTAVLVSVTPEVGNNGDKIITQSEIDRALGRAGKLSIRSEALVIRTLPNDDSKLAAIYDANNVPPYFAVDAIERIVSRGFTHLLVDLPSIDPLFDEGKLQNHRIFWNVTPAAFDVNEGTRTRSTITELIYVPSSVADGQYLLNIQIPPFVADAAPSRPILFPMKRVRKGPGGAGMKVGPVRPPRQSSGAKATSPRLRERA